MKYHAIIVHILELIAALAGFYYLRRYSNSKLRALVYFLVFTICLEAIGTYTSFIEVFDFLKPIKNTIFRENFWLYNFYITGSLIFYIVFYKNVIIRASHKKILKALLFLSVVVLSFNIYNAGWLYFKMYLKYNFIWTTFCVFMCVAFYFYEVLMSDKILVFYKSSMFYISIGLLVWWLVMPPFIFYMPYYKEIYPEMVKIRGPIMLSTNIILYGCYTIGFLWGKE